MAILFQGSVCGANCHGIYDSVIWDDQGFRYRVNIKISRRRGRDELVDLANAAIENQQ